jgi:AcrR family transcriptional regulator
LLAAADELFYEEGVHIVGIDRVIERAGVAKASLYSAFGSKDELIRAYLVRRHAARRERLTEALAAHETPRERLLAVFDILGESFADPRFHGCAFVNASAEAPADSPIQEAAAEYRAWIRGVFEDLARQAGAPEPERLARQFVLLYDGAAISARMDRGSKAAACARVAASALLDASLGADGTAKA